MDKIFLYLVVVFLSHIYFWSALGNQGRQGAKTKERKTIFYNYEN